MMWRGMPFRNLIRRPARTVALLLLVLLLSFTMFGGAILLLSLQRGTKSLEGRLGADVIVVPSQMASKVNLDNLLLMGTTGSYYMDQQVLSLVQEVEGVEKASAQLFMASLRAACCSVAVQVIGFDPDQDLTVLPWVERSYKKELGELEVLVGSQVNADVGESIRIYEQNCPVVGRLEKTGTRMDTAIYATLDTVRLLLEAARELGHDLQLPGEVQEVISAIYVKVKDDRQAEKVAGYINGHIRKVEAIATKNMLTQISDSMAGVSFLMKVLIVVIWTLVFFLILIAFLMILRERRREFATLRVLGASPGMLSLMVLEESALICLGGALGGICLAALTLLPFHGLLEEFLDLPFLMPEPITLGALLAGTLLLSLTTGTLASLWSAWKLGHVEVSTVLREE